MSYRGESTDGQTNRQGIGDAGYREPYPGGMPPHPSQQAYQQTQPHLQLSPEELAFSRRRANEHVLTRALPMSLGAALGFNTLCKRGIFKVKRVGLCTFGIGFVTFMAARINGLVKLRRQIIKKFPDGVVARTQSMTLQEKKEYANRLAIERANHVVEAALVDQSSTERSQVDPESRNQVAGLDDRYRPSLDSPDFNKKLDNLEESESSASRKTSYAELRRQSRRDMRPEPALTVRQDKNPVTEDDPPSKLRTKKNKYGDDIE